MSWTVVEVDGNGVRETRRGGTLGGNQAAETKLEVISIPSVSLRGTLAGYQAAETETKPKPKMVTWRLCSDEGAWFRSGEIPQGWVALEAHTRPLETIKQLPEGEEP